LTEDIGNCMTKTNNSLTIGFVICVPPWSNQRGWDWQNT